MVRTTLLLGREKTSHAADVYSWEARARSRYWLIISNRGVVLSNRFQGGTLILIISNITVGEKIKSHSESIYSQQHIKQHTDCLF